MYDSHWQDHRSVAIWSESVDLFCAVLEMWFGWICQSCWVPESTLPTILLLPLAKVFDLVAPTARDDTFRASSTFVLRMNAWIRLNLHAKPISHSLCGAGEPACARVCAIRTASQPHASLTFYIAMSFICNFISCGCYNVCSGGAKGVPIEKHTHTHEHKQFPSKTLLE